MPDESDSGETKTHKDQSNTREKIRLKVVEACYLIRDFLLLLLIIIGALTVLGVLSNRLHFTLHPGTDTHTQT